MHLYVRHDVLEVTKRDDWCYIRLCDKPNEWAKAVVQLDRDQAIAVRDGLLKLYPLEDAHESD